jgi:hypothetical protein
MSMELPPSTTPISESDSSLAYSAKVQETCDDIAVAANPKQVALDSARKRLRLLPASRTFLEEILPVLLNGNDEERAAAKERYEHFETELLNSHETETHVGLMESFEPRYQGMALELSSQIIIDYKCETAAEKATAELAANAFVRAIACSRKFNRLSEEYWLTGKEQTTHMAMYSKQIDRSYRQYASAISLLSQLKSPRPEIIIRTNNAFVAQSQQINAGTPPA